MPRLLLSIILFLTLLTTCGPALPPSTAPASAPRFTLLGREETHITFNNDLTEGPNTNILMYEYFYNGGGVAVGDLNGDELPDLYFTANMADNHVYLNQGNFEFTDITEASQAGGRSWPWKTGVTFVDINGDNKLDIYVCYSGALPASKRANQLFINQGNGSTGVPTFREEAGKYGLAGTGYTNQAYFFDCDGDNDLDAILLNHNPKSLPRATAAQNRKLVAIPDRERGLRLYRNDGQKYTDVTEAAGISGSALSYGLGLALSDVDGDGDTDFYVSNDYEVPDYLYLNNGDGTFVDVLGRSMSHTSHFSMGSDIGDPNNDGRPDIFTLDMLPADNYRRKLLMADDNRSVRELNIRSGFHDQTMRNMLHLNIGNGHFAEVGQFAGVATTDWSWSALFADLDNDGWQDLHVTNGYLKDYTNLDFIKYMEDFVAARGRLQRADLRAILQEMPASDVSNYVFANGGDLVFADSTQAWGLARPSNSNGAAYADLDRDGDLDLIVNNLESAAFVYRNDGASGNYLDIRLNGPSGNTCGVGAKVLIITNTGTQSRELFPNRGYQSAIEPTLHFGLGALTQVQSMWVEWPDGKEQTYRDIAVNQTLTLSWEDADSIDTGRPSTEELPIFEKISLTTNATYPGPTIRDFDAEPLIPKQYSGPFAEVVVESGGPKIVERSNRSITTDGSEMTVRLNNYDSGTYPTADAVTVIVNRDGTRLRVPLPTGVAGRVNDAEWMDLDGDGTPELLLAGEWMPLSIYAVDLTTGAYGVTDVTSKYLRQPASGWWNSVANLGDLNGDDRPDFLAGNHGTNGRFRPSTERPLEMHVSDFDGNGSLDPIISFHAGDGRRYPDATRDELLGQLTKLRGDFPNYESYAVATLENVFPQWPSGTQHLSVDRLETTLYLSGPGGVYEPAPLPQEVQFAPVHTITVLDFDGDGTPDLLLCGNEGMAKQRWGVTDAGAATLLRGTTAGTFEYVPPHESGLYIRGDVRSVHHSGDTLLFGVRGKPVVGYQINRDAEL